ncbi:MAG: hypothetical protein ACKO2G_15585 [Verrucomicrobiales bacterium]
MKYAVFSRILWDALPLKVCFFGVALLWGAKEFYPLSHFPMYSNFGQYDYVVFISDQNGKPLPLEALTAGVRTAKLKKKFDGELGKVQKEIGKRTGSRPKERNMTAEQMAPAGKIALEWIMPRLEELRSLPPDVTGVQLRHVGISYENGKIAVTEPRLLAELPAPVRP